MEHLHEFEGKPLLAAEKAELDVTAEPAADGELAADAAEALAKWLKEKLGERVEAVRVSKRLVSSPAVVLESDRMLTSSMRRILQSVNKQKDKGKQDLEINPRHGIIVRLDKIRQSDEPLATKVAEQIYDNARLSAGLLEDPRTMLKRLDELLQQVLEK